MTVEPNILLTSLSKLKKNFIGMYFIIDCKHVTEVGWITISLTLLIIELFVYT